MHMPLKSMDIITYIYISLVSCDCVFMEMNMVLFRLECSPCGSVGSIQVLWLPLHSTDIEIGLIY